MTPYRTSFTAGALDREAAVLVVEAVRRGTALETVSPDVLPINSAAGRRRKASELIRRLGSAPRETWEDLPYRSVAEQHLILYYCCLKTYRLLFDFHMDVVLPAWRAPDRTLRPHAARRFLERRADEHPEIDAWSPGTWDKVQQVMLKMLREAGLLRGERLQRPDVPAAFWHRFVRVGDRWYLEAVFLNQDQRAAVVAALRT